MAIFVHLARSASLSVSFARWLAASTAWSLSPRMPCSVLYVSVAASVLCPAVVKAVSNLPMAVRYSRVASAAPTKAPRAAVAAPATAASPVFAALANLLPIPSPDLPALSALSDSSSKLSAALSAPFSAFLVSFDTSAELSPKPSTASAVSRASFSYRLSAASAETISRCSARTCSSDTSPRLNCSCTCFSAVFKVFKRSAVFSIACDRISCFWASRSVLPGSSLSSLLTSLSSPDRSMDLDTTFSSAFPSLVVSPPISTVMPLITFLAILRILPPQFFAERRPIGRGLLHAPRVVQVLGALFRLAQLVYVGVPAPCQILQIVKLANLQKIKPRIL